MDLNRYNSESPVIPCGIRGGSEQESWVDGRLPKGQ
jgi:hypothetical protein